MRSLSLAVLLLVLLVLATSSLPAQFANDPNQTATAAKPPVNPNIQPGGENPAPGTNAAPTPANPNPGPNTPAASTQNPPTGQPTIPPSQVHQTPGQPPQAIQPSNLSHPANTTYH
jgi:protein-disulfide isomerase